jgi:uncharacterized protein
MTRPKCCRKIAVLPEVRHYLPNGESASLKGEVILSLDELEAIRLADFEELYQENAAAKMGISRQTFGRIIESAHKKIADSILHGKALKIDGGNVSVRKSAMQKCRKCSSQFERVCGKKRETECPICQKKSKDSLQ